MPRRCAALLAATILAVTALPSRAAAPVESITGGAEVLQTATITPPSTGDVVTVTQISTITADLEGRVAAAAQEVGAVVAPSRGAGIGMTAVIRGGNGVQLAPAGFMYPMGLTVLSTESVAALMGRQYSAPIAAGHVLMARSSAEMRGAQAGDTLTLIGGSGAAHVLTVGLVADDAVLGGAELIVSPGVADVLGVTQVTRLLIHGVADRGAIDAALSARGVTTNAVVGGQRTKVRRSWDPRDPDATLGVGATKALLGEFAYRVYANGEVGQSPEWVATHLPAGREWIFAYQGAPAHSAYTLRARCHRTILPDLVAALGEVHAAGLDPAIDFVNANTYGGCHYARFNRVSGGLGFLSRHSWGMAVDTNTTTNAQGSTPQMDCRVVRIFRKHNFAWGGNFTSRDGMHFEWVGERRDQMPYPSTYCPNQAGPAPMSVEGTTVIGAAGDSRATLFADDGWAPPEDH